MITTINFHPVTQSNAVDQRPCEPRWVEVCRIESWLMTAAGVSICILPLAVAPAARVRSISLEGGGARAMMKTSQQQHHATDRPPILCWAGTRSWVRCVVGSEGRWTRPEWARQPERTSRACCSWLRHLGRTSTASKVPKVGKVPYVCPGLAVACVNLNLTRCTTSNIRDRPCNNNGNGPRSDDVPRVSCRDGGRGWVTEDNMWDCNLWSVAVVITHNRKLRSSNLRQ